MAFHAHFGEAKPKKILKNILNIMANTVDSICGSASSSGVTVLNYSMFQFSNCHILVAFPIDSATPKYQPCPHEKSWVTPAFF